MNIRPVSDLRNRYPEVEKTVETSGPVFLTKNGHGSMVLMSIEQFEHLNGSIERALDEADAQAALLETRYSHAEVFGSLRKLVTDGRQAAV